MFCFYCLNDADIVSAKVYFDCAHVGFRCGTCREFPVFDLRTRKALRLLERPLIAMDVTLLSQKYMALQPKRALDWIERLSDACHLLEGTFTGATVIFAFIYAWLSLYAIKREG